MIEPSARGSGAAAEDARDDAERALLDELAAVRAEIDRLDARSIELHAALAASALDRAGHNQLQQSLALRSMAREVGCRTTVTHGVARHALEDALVRSRSFPGLVRAQADGRLTARQATVLADEALVLLDGDVSQQQRDRYVERAIDLAADVVPAKLRIRARQLVEDVASVPVTVRYERAVQDRYVAVQDAEDGMAYLTAFLPGVQAHAIKDRLDTGAESKCAEDARTRDQWRADALAAALIRGTGEDDVHRHCDEPACTPRMLEGITARIAITVPMLSLAIDDPYFPVQPAMLDGRVPMSMTAAATLISGQRGAMQRWLTHPVTGQVIAVDTRFASAQLRREVDGRDGVRCRQASCGATRNLQHDHNRRWADGGATSLTNTAALCPSCHTVKDSTRWSVHLDADGTARWTSPLGAEYLDRPVPPDIPLDPDALPIAPGTG